MFRKLIKLPTSPIICVCEKELDRQWLTVQDELGVSENALLKQSPLDRARRTYIKGKYVYKIVLLKYDMTSHLRNCSLAQEFELLSLCKFEGMPEAIRYEKTGDYEFIVLDYIDGKTLSETELKFISFISLLFKLTWLILKLSRAGISHNDIRETNIIISQDGKIFLIDFDQATKSTFWIALITNLAGINIGKKNMTHGSIIRVIKEQFKKRLSPKRIMVIKKILGCDDEVHVLPTIPENADHQLLKLLDAWKLAQSSIASSPGQLKAYYSLNVGGYRFPGERPWAERWDVLQTITEFSGKKILELGCNMGLLSTFLIKEKLAAKAMAIDADENIIKCAEMVSSAFGVKLTLEQVNFDSPENWETVLSKFEPDLVFALNVLNWVQDKKRFMNFLGHFPEIIFEGHDSIEVETKRFKDVGFKQINLISITERKRPILHCVK